VMRELVDHYEALAALARSEAVGPQIQRQMQDAAFTLCVSTDRQDVDAALAAAREQLDGDFGGEVTGRWRDAGRRFAAA
jgi:hypothetical protein